MSRGFAAIGILMTLLPHRAIDSTVGSLLRRELPTGLRDGDGCAAGKYLASPLEEVPRSGQGCEFAAKRLSCTRLKPHTPL